MIALICPFDMKRINLCKESTDNLLPQQLVPGALLKMREFL